MTKITALDCIRDAIKTAELEVRALEIEEALNILCDHISPPDCLNLTKIDMRYNRLHRELCDIYQSLHLRYRSLAQ